MITSACKGQPAAASQRVREPAVAGLFYPKEPAALSQTLEQLLANAVPQTLEGDLRALICPHAGYQFSGPVAASAFRLLLGHDFQTVMLLAVSHYAAFAGASVSDANIYRTPLGDVPISPKAAALAKLKPFVLESCCFLRRPDWASQASHPLPPTGTDTPETWEHSGEVEVPFLQKTLKDFSLVPVVTGEVDPAQMAQALATQWDDKTLIVASTDLSHYHPITEARTLDTATVNAIVNLDIERMQSVGDACGKTPVLALMHLAKLKGWRAKLLDCRNSGDTTGDTRSDATVVGYGAIAFYAPSPQTFSAAERRQLLAFARQSLRSAVTRSPTVESNPAAVPEKFNPPTGCFVTLTKHGQLRGCIGHIIPQVALHKAIADNAQSAALHDGRFSPVQPVELDQIEIEISVLTVPVELPFKSPEDLLQKLQPYRDGVVLQMNGDGATYLPQVWAQIPDKVAFLNSLAQKAGRAATDWRKPGTKIFIYHVESFSESAL
ncbi:MAG: AmmeMemoRadiSam system protein B [Verrucomicrobiota bacterium]